MLTNLWSKLDGYKVYILGLVIIMYALAGHFFGPIDQGALQIPAMDWAATWALVWKGCLVIAGRSTAEKVINPAA